MSWRRGLRTLGYSAVLLCLPTSAWAGRILFVSDSETDRNIPGALRAAGHVVDVVLNDYRGGENPRLQQPLDAYDAVYWSATGGGRGDVHRMATTAALTRYVNNGGFVFVTGSDVVVSPADPEMVTFLGATGAVDVPAAPTAVINAENELATGEVDLRGVAPANGSGDRDALTGVGTDTVVVAGTEGDATRGQWTIRTVGSGRIAFVSNGDGGSPSAAPSWERTVSGADGAYNAALRNFAFHASGARVLFVSDSRTDTNIPAVLRRDGHRVTEVLNDFSGGNARLRASLEGYDAVVWSATGSGFGDEHNPAVTANLSAWVAGGGHLLVTGNDAIASPVDPPLIALIGGTSSIDLPGAPGAVINQLNELTSGVVDLRGVTPTGGNGDLDGVLGVGESTVAVLPTASDPTRAQWTVRALGVGRVAFISNGQAGPISAHPSWENTSVGGAGAYNAALRNFAFHAAGARVLFVSDTRTDTNIPGLLRFDGHRVAQTLNDFAGGNARLRASLAGFDAVVWSATGDGFGEEHDPAVTANLASFVRAGGRVLVIGNDAVASPEDPPLIDLLGASTSVDLPDPPNAVARAMNALSAGRVDVRGVIPTGANGDLDALRGLGTDTAAVVTTTDAPGDAQWTLRSLGAGQVAFVSNGEAGPVSAHASWDVRTAGGAGAYNAAVRNFIHSVDRLPRTAVTGAANGLGCTDNAQCGSGFCVDGVCCNSACEGGTSDCQACAVALGAAADGTCGPVQSGRVCRRAAGVCDRAETCNGTATACPTDAFAMDGTACGDGVTCNGAETCRAGLCAAGTAVVCNDMNPCTTDRCAEPSGCTFTTVQGCGDAGTDAGADVVTPRDVVAASDVVTAPDVMMASDVVAAPDVVTTSDVVTAPDVVTASDVVTAPDVVTATDVVAAPDVVREPDGAVVDAGSLSDATSAPDAAILTDAAVVDVATALDVAAAADAPIVVDAERKDILVRDAATVADVTTGADGGGTVTPATSGCGCAVPGSSAPRGSLLGLLAGLGLLLRRRRRAR